MTGRGPSRLRDGGEGGPALRAHLQFLTLLAGPPPLAGERAENFCWDKRSLCILFFFFFLEWDSVSHSSLLWLEDLVELLKP